MTRPTASRRLILQMMAVARAFPQVSARQEPSSLPPWSPGEMDIHHISTGRGNCAFVIAPDATTFMIDAGSLFPQPGIQKYVVPAYPDESKSPGEWIARYVKRRLRGLREAEIDVFLASHFHGDHIGEIRSDGPRSPDGSHQLTGIAEIASQLRVGKIIDRGYPDYDYPVPFTEDYQKNYVAFLECHRRNGGAVERFIPGSASQIRLLRAPQSYPDFNVRNVAANGEVWTGVAETARRTFPSLDGLEPRDYPTENMCSIALRLSHGKFDYFTAGDMSGATDYGRLPWHDIETQAAKAAGPVEVAVASHHGYEDATGPGYVAALRPRVFLILAWDSAHPTIHALHNMLSTRLYEGPRDVFSTAMKSENRIVLRRLSELKSSIGHIVIRVDPSGSTFRIFITDNSNESDAVMAAFGPYPCA